MPNLTQILTLYGSVQSTGYRLLLVYYYISKNIDSDFNLAIRQLRKDYQINLCHYWSIHTTCMGLSTYGTQNRWFKILPKAFLNKSPNIMFANNSAYTICITGWICTHNEIDNHTNICTSISYCLTDFYHLLKHLLCT